MIEDRIKEIDQELSEIGNPENDYKRFIELLMEYNKLKYIKCIEYFERKMKKTDSTFFKHEYFNCMKQLEELLMEENNE